MLSITLTAYQLILFVPWVLMLILTQSLDTHFSHGMLSERAFFRFFGSIVCVGWDLAVLLTHWLVK